MCEDVPDLDNVANLIKE